MLTDIRSCKDRWQARLLLLLRWERLRIGCIACHAARIDRRWLETVAALPQPLRLHLYAELIQVLSVLPPPCLLTVALLAAPILLIWDHFCSCVSSPRS